MPRYAYKARDERGQQVSGRAEAESQEALADRLSRTGYLITEIRVEKEDAMKRDLFERVRGVPAREHILLSFHLSNALSAGLPLVRVLEAVSPQVKSAKLRRALTEVVSDLKAGRSFSEALQRHPRVFSRYFVSLVASGETAGKLGVTLKMFSESLEREVEFQGKIASAIAYPILLAVVAAGIVTFLMTAIMPKFIKIFQEAKVALPLPTMLLVALTNALQRYWPYLVGGSLLAVVAARRYLATSAGRYQADRLKLKLPLVGKVLQKIYISRFMRTFGILYTSGVPIMT